MQDITSKISCYVANLNYAQLPKDVVELVKMYIVDYYAACLAGYRVNEDFNTKVLELMKQMGGSEESSIFFSKQKLPASNAAFMNAIYAHGADMDDGNRKAAGHIGAHVMSSVFAVAEMQKSTWEEVIVAIVAGYDVYNRVVGAGQPHIYNNGYHSTGVGGSLACAAACAKLLKLNEEEIYNAISLSAIQSSGLIIIDESGQNCKPINPANAARTGVLSAQLAKLGITSSRNPLESKKGWFNAFAREVDEELLFEGWNEKYTICESYLKLYPSCRHTHCCIDASLDVFQHMKKDKTSIFDIEDIEVIIYPSAIKSTGSIRYPKNVDEAKFSLCYCIATALEKGVFGLDELNVNLSKGVEYIVPKIRFIEDASMEDRKKGIRGAKMVVKTKHKVYEETVLIPKGEASKPLVWEDLYKKVEQCAGNLCTLKQQQELIESIRKADCKSEFVCVHI